MDWFKGKILTGNHVVPFPWHIGLKASYWFLLSCCLRMIIVHCNFHHYICLWSLINNIWKPLSWTLFVSCAVISCLYYVAYYQCGILIFVIDVVVVIIIILIVMTIIMTLKIAITTITVIMETIIIIFIIMV
jgi:hypothetical protein